MVAARAPLSADEAYYWVWSKALAPGYLDHPPMVALWIRLGTWLAGDTPLGVRLLGPFSALAGTWLLARAAEDFFPGRQAGPVAALLLNATLVLNAGAVVMTPDTPLLFFWTASLAALARLHRSRHAAWWLAVGGAAGLALDSKYTATLLGLGIALWLVLFAEGRLWLRRWQCFAGGALALALFTPVLAWNAAHGWASFAKQGGRAADFQPTAALRFLSELFGGQIGLATPALACVFALALWRVARGVWRRDSSASLLACVTLAPAAVFLQHALGDRVQANWPAILYPGAALAASFPAVRWWRHACAFGLAVSVLVLVQAGWAPLSLPRKLDFALIRLAGWTDLAGSAYVVSLGAGARFVAADEYGLASELAFRLRGPVVSHEARWQLFDLPQISLADQIGVLVRSDRQRGAPDPSLWPDATVIGHATRARGGVTAESYTLYRVRGAGSAVLLPRSLARLEPD